MSDHRLATELDKLHQYTHTEVVPAKATLAGAVAKLESDHEKLLQMHGELLAMLRLPKNRGALRLGQHLDEFFEYVDRAHKRFEETF